MTEEKKKLQFEHLLFEEKKKKNRCVQCGRGLSHYKIMLHYPDLCLKHQRELDRLQKDFGSEIAPAYLNGVKPLKILKTMERENASFLKKLRKKIESMERSEKNGD